MRLSNEVTKQAWLGIIEHRKAAEYELRRLLTLKYEKNDHNNINNHKKNDELQHQKTGIYVFMYIYLYNKCVRCVLLCVHICSVLFCLFYFIFY